MIYGTPAAELLMTLGMRLGEAPPVSCHRSVTRLLRSLDIIIFALSSGAAEKFVRLFCVPSVLSACCVLFGPARAVVLLRTWYGFSSLPAIL